VDKKKKKIKKKNNNKSFSTKYIKKSRHRKNREKGIDELMDIVFQTIIQNRSCCVVEDIECGC
jgi:hypothetical protein